MLKCDFHIHSSDDPQDMIRHSVFDLLKIAAAKRYDTISITNHCAISFSSEAKDFAESLGILLLPGIELTLRGKHVVVINADKDVLKVRTFDSLKSYRGEHPESFVFAPHPYYPAKSCLGNLLERHIELFDGIEFCHFYLSFFNVFNRKALAVAERHARTVLACSDTHSLIQFGSTWTWVDAEKDKSSVIQALKNRKTDIFTTPMPLSRCIKAFFRASIKKKKWDDNDEK